MCTRQSEIFESAGRQSGGIVLSGICAGFALREA